MKIINEYYSIQRSRIQLEQKAIFAYIKYMMDEKVEFSDLPEKPQKSIKAIIENMKNPPNKRETKEQAEKRKKGYAGVTLELLSGLFESGNIDFVPIQVKYRNRLKDVEREMQKDMKGFCQLHDIWTKWLIEVKGIGPVLASVIIQCIDIHRAAHRSSLYKICGYGVDRETGKAERLEAGKKISWNPVLKKTCFLIATSFIKSNSQYRQFYDHRKAFELNRGTLKNHAHMRALRFMVKQFLSDLYVVWRELEGLPVSNPWIVDNAENHDLRPLVVEPLK